MEDIPTNRITGGVVIPPGLPAGAAGGTYPFYFQQPPSIRRDDAGVVTSVPYESSAYGQIFPLLIGLGFPYDYESSFGKTRLVIHYPFDFSAQGAPGGSTPETSVESLWEMFDQKVEKDFLSADMPIGSIGAIDSNDAYLIRTAQQQSQQGLVISAPQTPLDGTSWFEDPVDANGQTLTFNGGADVPAAVNPYGCYSLLLLVLRGQSSFPVFAPVLRWTQTVTSQYAIQASLLNARNIISTATMYTLESIPSGLLFSLPNDSNPPTQFIQTPGDLVYGWFKDFPTIRQIARLKWNIVQEWQYGLWPTVIYGDLL